MLRNWNDLLKSSYSLILNYTGEMSVEVSLQNVIVLTLRVEMDELFTYYLFPYLSFMFYHATPCYLMLAMVCCTCFPVITL